MIIVVKLGTLITISSHLGVLVATVRHLASGRWQALIRRTGVKPISKTFRTKAMAQNWARRKEDEMKRGLYHNVSAAERTTLQ